MDATEVDVKMQEEGNADTNEKKARKEETEKDTGCGSSALSPSVVEKSVVGSSTNSQSETTICKNINIDDSDVKMEEVSTGGNTNSDASSGSQFPPLPPPIVQNVRDIALPGEVQGETSTTKKTAFGVSHEGNMNWMEIKDKSLENEAYAGASYDLLPSCKTPQENLNEVCRKEGSIIDDQETGSTMPEQVSSKEGDSDTSKSMVPDKKRKITCEVCSKTVRASNMKNHMRIHTGERPFPCDVCPKTFSHINHQKQHMRIHTGEKPFTCKICNMSFRKKCQFVKHWQKHMKNNPFTCDVCSKTFPRWDILTKHKSYHTKENAYGSDNRTRQERKASQRHVILGCMNVRGCSLESKRNDIGCLMQERKIDVLALSETHVKGKGEVMFGKVKGQVSGVEEGDPREGVAVLVSESLQDNIIEYKLVTSRIMWVRMKIERECWVFLSAYGPGYETSLEEQIEFWSRLTRCLDKLQKRANVVVLGDLNARVGSSVIRGVVGRYGVPGRNENGMRLLDMCLKKKLAIGNTFFKKKLIHKYTHTRMANGGMTDNAMTDFVLITRRVFGRLKDVHVFRGVAAISDHFLVKTKLAVGRVKLIKGAAGAGSSEGGEAEIDTEAPGNAESDIVGEMGVEEPGVPGEDDSDVGEVGAEEPGVPGEADSDVGAKEPGVPGQADSDVAGEVGAKEPGVPGQTNSDAVEVGAKEPEVPGQADSDVGEVRAKEPGVPGQANIDAMEVGAKEPGVPSQADSDVGEVGAKEPGLPGQADSDVVRESGTKEPGVPSQADSDVVGESGTKEPGVPDQADSDVIGESGLKEPGVTSQANSNVGEVEAKEPGVPGQADSDVVVEVGTKRARQDSDGEPGKAGSDVGEVEAKKAREETGEPGKVDSDVIGE